MKEDRNWKRLNPVYPRTWRSTEAMNGALLELYRHKTWATLP